MNLQPLSGNFNVNTMYSTNKLPLSSSILFTIILGKSHVITSA